MKPELQEAIQALIEHVESSTIEPQFMERVYSLALEVVVEQLDADQLVAPENFRIFWDALPSTMDEDGVYFFEGKYEVFRALLNKMPDNLIEMLLPHGLLLVDIWQESELPDRKEACFNLQQILEFFIFRTTELNTLDALYRRWIGLLETPVLAVDEEGHHVHNIQTIEKTFFNTTHSLLKAIAFRMCSLPGGDHALHSMIMQEWWPGVSPKKRDAFLKALFIRVVVQPSLVEETRLFFFSLIKALPDAEIINASHYTSVQLFLALIDFDVRPEVLKKLWDEVIQMLWDPELNLNEKMRYFLAQILRRIAPHLEKDAPLTLTALADLEPLLSLSTNNEITHETFFYSKQVINYEDDSLFFLQENCMNAYEEIEPDDDSSDEEDDDDAIDDSLSPQDIWNVLYQRLIKMANRDIQYVFKHEANRLIALLPHVPDKKTAWDALITCLVTDDERRGQHDWSIRFLSTVIAAIAPYYNEAAFDQGARGYDCMRLLHALDAIQDNYVAPLIIKAIKEVVSNDPSSLPRTYVREICSQAIAKFQIYATPRIIGYLARYMNHFILLYGELFSYLETHEKTLFWNTLQTLFLHVEPMSIQSIYSDAMTALQAILPQIIRDCSSETLLQIVHLKNTLRFGLGNITNFFYDHELISIYNGAYEDLFASRMDILMAMVPYIRDDSHIENERHEKNLLRKDLVLFLSRKDVKFHPGGILAMIELRVSMDPVLMNGQLINLFKRLDNNRSYENKKRSVFVQKAFSILAEHAITYQPFHGNEDCLKQAKKQFDIILNRLFFMITHPDAQMQNIGLNAINTLTNRVVKVMLLTRGQSFSYDLVRYMSQFLDLYIGPEKNAAYNLYFCKVLFLRLLEKLTPLKSQSRSPESVGHACALLEQCWQLPAKINYTDRRTQELAFSRNSSALFSGTSSSSNALAPEEPVAKRTRQQLMQKQEGSNKRKF